MMIFALGARARGRWGLAWDGTSGNLIFVKLFCDGRSEQNCHFQIDMSD